jgi:hypothetical protein
MIMDSGACRQILEAAVASPSAENKAPYRLRWHPDAELQVRLDPRLSGKVSDKGFLLSDLATGAAIESMVLKALALGYTATVALFPAGTADPHYAASIRFFPLDPDVVPDPAEVLLSEQILSRCTDRRFPFQEPVSPQELDSIQSILTSPDCQLDLFNTLESRTSVAWLIHAAEKIRFEDKSLHGELFDAIVFNRKFSPYGMNLDVVGVSRLETLFFYLMSKWSILKVLNVLGASWMLAYKSAVVPVRSSPAMLLLSTAATDRDGIVAAGRQMQRVWLQCTALGLAVQIHAAPGVLSLSKPATAARHVSVISKITAQLRQFTGQNRQGLIFFRIGRVSGKPQRSGRPGLEDIQQ